MKLLKHIAALLLGLAVIVVGVLLVVWTFTSWLFWEIVFVSFLLGVSWIIGVCIIGACEDWRKNVQNTSNH